MDKKKNIILAVILIVVFLVLVEGTQFFRKKGTSSSELGQAENNSSSSSEVGQGTNNNSIEISANTLNSKMLNQDELFTERDLKQEADLTSAKKYEVSSNTDINITSEGVYVISGTAENVTINVNARDEEKVQLVLDNLSISNTDKECIHVENADKVFITTNTKASFKYLVKDTENATSAILSRSDIVFNGKGTLEIDSNNNAINGKDDVKITGGTYNITASKNGIRANDSIQIVGGTFNIKSGTDGLHAENNDDDSKGFIFINSCELNIEASDDGIHAVSILQIDGGTINVTAGEGLEGTYIQINDGTITIEASDDGINAAKKSSSYTPTIMLNGGYTKVNMKNGDTDGIDSNGDIIINGGTIEVTGSSTFDYDGKAEHNGGTIIVNGKETDAIPNQFMDGMTGGRGGRGFPSNMDGEFERKGPKNFSGDFDGRINPPDMENGFNYQKRQREI